MAKTIQDQHEALRLRGWSVQPDSDQPGRFCFISPADEGSDISYDSEDDAIRAAFATMNDGYEHSVTLEQQSAVLQEMSIRVNRDPEDDGRWYWYPDGGEVSQRYETEDEAIRAAYKALPDLRYELDVRWSCGALMRVNAKSPTMAKKYAIDEAPLPDGDYLSDSFLVNEVAEV